MVSGDIVRFSSTTARSNIGLVVIYCVALMWRWEIYTPIGHSPHTIALQQLGGYSQSPVWHQGIQPEIYCATQLFGQELEDLGAHPTPFHYFHGAPLVQSITELLHIHKYIILDLLPHELNMLEDLAYKLVFPVHIHVLNRCKKSFKLLKSERYRSMLIIMVFQSTFTRSMIWYYLIPLGVRRIVAHVHSIANYPVSNDSCIISTTINHLGESVFFSACSTTSQISKFSDRIPYGPPYQFGRTHLRYHSISSSARILFVTSTSSNITVMCLFSLSL